jgi:SAM-dependent methyltransferase
MNNFQYLKNHYNNFIYPKPTEDIEEDYLKKNRRSVSDPTIFFHRIFPEKKFSKEKLNILIAGCGSHEAAILAKFNPQHNIIGIDLSENSIMHQEKLVKKHKIKNLSLICNDFRKEKFNIKFDYIISAGVIHHLEDPGSALDCFNNLLKDDGAISLMVYGDKINYSLNQVKLLFEKLDLNHDIKSINFSKNFLNKLNDNHPAKLFARTAADLNFEAGIVDFLLHKSEKFFSIKDLIKLLNNSNLFIKNLNNGTIFSLTKFFIGLDNTEFLEKLRKLNIEDQLELGQILNWNDRKISIICAKKLNLNKSIIYNLNNFEDFYVSKNPELLYEINNNILIIKSSLDKETYKFTILDNSNKFWEEVLCGKYKTKDLLFSLDPSKLEFNKNIIKVLIENYLLDLSFNEIILQN